MNELICINYESEKPTVSGRELYAALEIEARYNDWFSRMCEYGFKNEKDFYSILSKSTGGRPSTDHAVTIRKCETNDERFGIVNSYPLKAWEDFMEVY